DPPVEGGPAAVARVDDGEGVRLAAGRKLDQRQSGDFMGFRRRARARLGALDVDLLDRGEQRDGEGVRAVAHVGDGAQRRSRYPSDDLLELLEGITRPLLALRRARENDPRLGERGI